MSFGVRHLPSIIASCLLFGFIGTPVGTILFLATWGVAAGKPTMMFQVFDDLDCVAGLAIFFGAAPAFVTGVVAGVVRIYVRHLLFLAFLMAPVGLAVTAIYLSIVTGGRGDAWGLTALVSPAGAAAGFFCSFLLWRNRPWLIAAS